MQVKCRKKQVHKKLDLACPQCWCLPLINLCCTKLTKGAVHQLCSATSPRCSNEVNTREPKETQLNLLHPLIWDFRASNNCRLTAAQTLGEPIAIWKIDSAFTLYNWNNCLDLWLSHLLPCANSHTKALYLSFYIPLTTWQSLLPGELWFQQECLLPRKTEGHKKPSGSFANNNLGRVVCSQLTRWFTQGSPGCSVQGDGFSSLQESSPPVASLQWSIQTPPSHEALI